MAEIEEDIVFVEDTAARLRDSQELYVLANSETDEHTLRDLAAELGELITTVAAKEREMQMSGPHDRSSALITIQAGAGGTDAQDWAQMLERMYLRLVEKRDWRAAMLDRSVGEEAGIKHSTFVIEGKYAYGLLKTEHGVHRLVRLSPYNADNLRQTSFARVEVIPKLSEREAPTIAPEDLEIDTFRSGGAGGQHVNKTSSAVRIRHIPTGIVVKCQNERSQGQNKAQAMSILQAKLAALAQEHHVKEIAQLRGVRQEAAWGNQIRSYVLHPYTLVKDHRTKAEVKDVQRVLDGDLSDFLNAGVV